MRYLFILSFISVCIGIVLLIIGAITERKKKMILEKHISNKYAILIPARDESKVIENLLKSIEIQNKDMSNVYVIVEDEKDKTCDITKKYKANIFVREKPIRPRKGYALDECIKEILKTKHYDLYFIFDADNILEKDFINKMLKSWHEGYDVAIGYRNILNPKNAISGCSGLMFSLINTLINKQKVKNNRPILLSGTGFYISGDIIEKIDGFPFNTLTEDYELSLYISGNNISSTYNDDAVYYDEQPLDMKTSIKQRTRWVKGFFEARAKRLKNVKNNLSSKLGVVPLIFIIFGLISIFILSIINIILNFNIYYLIIILLVPFILYILLFLLTFVLLIEDEKINLNNNLKIKCLLFNPIFLFLFVHCFLRSIIIKNVGWDVIKHKGV